MQQILEIQGKTYTNPLIVFAMEVEAGKEFHDQNVIITGIGKVNAAYALTKAIQEHQPDIIINLGTAGSNTLKRGEVGNCTSFVQRDMDVSPLGFEKYKTPLSEEEIILKYGIQLDSQQAYCCGTGDSFDTGHSEDLYQIVDMEAYVLAYIAKQENIPFLCLKYISDGADDDAASDWTEEVKRAGQKLKEVLFSN